MSSTLVKKVFHIANVHYGRRFVVDRKRPETVAEYVRRIRAEKELSLEKVSKRSGNRIAPSYLHKIENGDVKNVSPEKLEALAAGLGVDEDEIFLVARGVMPKPMTPKTFAEALEAMGITEFSAFSETLNPDEMEEIVAVVRAQLEVKYNRKKKTKK